MTSEDLREAYRAFTTTVGLITTNGPRGPNVMAAEWTFNVSYKPFLIAVLVDPANATHDAILEAKEFGVNLAAEDQVAAVGFAGHYSKADTDKLSSEVFETFPARKIRAPLIRGCLLNAECVLRDHVRLGDHTAFIGEVVAFTVDPAKPPLVHHAGARQLGPRIPRGPRLLLAVTPMIAPPGSRAAVTGELTAPDRAHRTVRIGADLGGRTSSADAITDAGGSFRASLEVPASAAPGTYRIRGTADGVEGAASLRVAGPDARSSGRTDAAEPAGEG